MQRRGVVLAFPYHFGGRGVGEREMSRDVVVCLSNLLREICVRWERQEFGYFGLLGPILS